MSACQPLHRLQIERAATFWQRFVGLLGRASLGADEALLISPCNNIHTCFMRFTIDVVFVDRGGVVVAVMPRVRPWRVAIATKAYACVELAAGGAERFGLQVGQSLPAVSSAVRRVA